MTNLNDRELDELLACAHPAPMPRGYMDRITQAAWNRPQSRSLWAALNAIVMDILYDVFGSREGLFAGAAAAIIIGFSIGYMQDDMIVESDEETLAEIYEIEEPEWVAAI